MRRLPRLIFTASTVGIIGCVIVASGEETTPTNPILRPAAVSTNTVSKSRSVSAQVAAELAAITPPFQKPEPSSATRGQPDEDEKPRNGIVRLPRYTVLEPRVHLPTEIQVLTPKGKIELAKKMYPGLRFGFLNDGVALAMLEELLQLERQQRAIDLMSLLPTNAAPGDGSTRTQSLIHDAMNPQSSWTRMTVERGP